MTVQIESKVSFAFLVLSFCDRLLYAVCFFRIELIVILTSKGIKEQETPGVTITPTVEYEQVISSSYRPSVSYDNALVHSEKKSFASEI